MIAMADFYRWEYNYGHNLDPTAAIRVPGMAYQPPLIGYKQLLNFGAYSIPDIGGWIFTAVAVGLFVLLLLEWRKNIRVTKKLEVLTASIMLMTLSSCSTEPRPISFDKEECNSCRMTISDKRFGAEVVTSKGKTYVFDDMHCLGQWLDAGNVRNADIAAIWLVDYSTPGTLIAAASSHLLHSEQLSSPMNGNVAAFKSPDSIHKFTETFPGEQTDWYSWRKH